MKINRVGIDLAKNVFQLHGTDSKGKAIWKRQLSRDKWLTVLFATDSGARHSDWYGSMY